MIMQCEHATQFLIGIEVVLCDQSWPARVCVSIHGILLFLGVVDNDAQWSPMFSHRNQKKWRWCTGLR